MSKGFDARFSFPSREESFELRNAVLSTEDENDVQKSSVRTILNSNLWDLQTKELLDEVTVDYRKIKWIENKLREIKGVISNLKVRKKSEIATDSVAFPLHSQRKIELEQFVRPNRVAVVGSFLLRSIAKPRVNIDLAVFIPSSTFVPKDLRDHRYTDKRNLYLKTMAKLLRKQAPELFDNMWYEALNGDKRRPVLCVGISKDMNKKKKKKKSVVAVRIVPALDPKDSPFDPKRLDLLNPRNNCRRRVVGEIEESQPITPHYTNAVLEDLSLESNLRHLHARSSNSRAFSLACVLIKIWLRQRGLDSIADGVNGFMMSMLMSHLFQDKQRVLSSQMGIFQIFRTFMTWLSKQTTLCVDMSTSSLSMSKLKDVFDTVCMSPSFEVTHQDKTKKLCLNLFARVSKYAFEELRYQAKRTLTMFAPGSDPMIGVQNIFVRRADILCRKDLVFWIKAPESPPSPPANLDSMDELRLDSSKAAQRKLRSLQNARARSIRTHNAVCDLGWRRVYADAVSDVITQGMGDRAYRVHATYDASETWSSSSEKEFRVCVQIDLNPDNAWECVQKGPSAEDKIASREFRSFWGKKSELRRFNDGTMLESVVWSCGDKDKSLDWQHRVPEMIVRHLVSRHFPTSSLSRGMSESFRFWQNHHSVRSDALKLFEVFSKLEKKLKSLPRHAMPLHVTQVRPMGPSFRYTASCEKHPLLSLEDQDSEEDLDRLPVPMEAVIRLESSAQWPDDVDAIRQTKAAFFLRLSEALRENYNIFSSVSRPEPQSYMDVCFEGYVFRLWMVQQRELHLLKKQSRLEELQTVRAQLQHRPHVTSLLRAVADQHRVFPETTMLIKTWFATHGLLNVHVNENLIELITAYVFCRTDAPSTAPQDTSAAFLRVMDLLANYDWQGLPLIVDPQSHLKPRHRRFVQESLDRDRARKIPEYSMYVVAAPASSELKTWGVQESKKSMEKPRRHIVPFFSKSRPSLLILKRIVSLARASLRVLRNAFESCVDDEEMSGRVATVFAPSNDSFDLVIRLRSETESLKRAETVLVQGTSIQPASKRRRILLKDSKFRNMKRSVTLNAAKECQRVAGFSPSRLLARSIESRLQGIALCFWNDQDLSTIGIVFRPNWLESKDFKLMTLMSRMPVDLKPSKKKSKKRAREESEVQETTIPNMKELIDDIKALGRGMILDVEISDRMKDSLC